MTDGKFWNRKRVLVTGHTGFKGSWLCLWLQLFGAEVSGYALEPVQHNRVFDALGIQRRLHRNVTGNVCDYPRLRRAILDADPEVVIHMAAQALVLPSYEDPVTTFEVNAIGTVNVLQAVRDCPSARAVVNVTTDKVYENKNQLQGYRESDGLGGHDPYSASKACSELITQSYRKSFFETLPSPVGIATARAGNVIGGGDYSRYRLIPDVMRAQYENEPLLIRHPKATRPWQHVLDSLSGYLTLAEHVWQDPEKFSGEYNFGPDPGHVQTVEDLLNAVQAELGTKLNVELAAEIDYHEAMLLHLDSTKAHDVLGWQPRWEFETAVRQTVAWFREFADQSDMRSFSEGQIINYIDAAAANDDASRAPARRVAPA